MHARARVFKGGVNLFYHSLEYAHIQGIFWLHSSQIYIEKMVLWIHARAKLSLLGGIYTFLLSILQN